MSDDATVKKPEEPKLGWSERIRIYRMLCRTSFKASPGLAVGGLILVPLSSAIYQITAYAMKLLADAVVVRNMQAAVSAAAVLTSLIAIGYVSGWWGAMVRMTVTERVGLALERRLGELVAGLPGLEHHERPEYLDKLALLRGRQGMLGQLMNHTIHYMSSIVSVVVTSLLLFKLSPWLLLLPIFGLPQMWVTGVTQRRYKKVEEQTAQEGRLAYHLYSLAIAPATGRELRVFNLQADIVDRQRTARMNVYRIFMRAHWISQAFNIVSTLCTSVGFVAALVFIAYRASIGRATPGDVLLASSLTHQMMGIVGDLRAPWWLEMLRFGQRMVWLEDYAEETSNARVRDIAAPVELRDGIRVRDLGFTYPGTDKVVLEGVNLNIPAGSVVALVGENGAGKTTLVKLVCRFYDPTSGEITVDGVDLRDIEPDEWRLRTSGAFQDFARLELLARETVGVGDLPVVDDEPAVAAALDRAGAAEIPSSLDHGLGTQLGRQWDDGVELSGGQWQKLALGRALMRTSPLVLVLDEPTAALDAETEHALFERFAAATRDANERGAITLLVSHRFSTVRMADLIVVISDGRVAEHGSHDELMLRGGLYAELYELQAKAYR